MAAYHCGNEEANQVGGACGNYRFAITSWNVCGGKHENTRCANAALTFPRLSRKFERIRIVVKKRADSTNSTRSPPRIKRRGKILFVPLFIVYDPKLQRKFRIAVECFNKLKKIGWGFNYGIGRESIGWKRFYGIVIGLLSGYVRDTILEIVPLNHEIFSEIEVKR